MTDDIVSAPDAHAAALLRTGFHAGSGDGVVIRLQGELDIATAPRLGRALDTALDARPDEIVLDLSELTFLDSSGIRVLMTACRRAKEQACSFILRSPGEPVMRTLRLTGVDNLMVIDIATPTT